MTGSDAKTERMIQLSFKDSRVPKFKLHEI
jgi:hypothetical protein